MKKNDTLFISMIGPEERVVGFFKEPNKPKIDNYLFLINKEYKDDSRVLEYKSKIEESLKGVPKDTLITSYFDSMELVKELNQYVLQNKIEMNLLNIYLDLSTFNRQNLLTLLFLLRRKYCVGNIGCYYTVPINTNKDISKCAHNAATIPFFGGEQSIDKNKLLILFVGFEYDRALYLWEKVEPSKTIIAVGDEPTDEKYLEKNLEVIASLKCRITDAEEVKVSAKDPYKAKQDVEEIIKRNMEYYNIIASPMNTKLQTLGLYLAWENFPEVQVVYTCPECFGDWLSTGIKRTDFFQIK